MPTRRGRAEFEADVGKVPADDGDEDLGQPGQQGGETAGYSQEHREDMDASGSRGSGQSGPVA